MAAHFQKKVLKPMERVSGLFMQLTNQGFTNSIRLPNFGHLKSTSGIVKNNCVNKMKKTDTVIIGQGIAGSLMAFLLHLHQIPFTVIDPACTNTSSRIAAGMFTPISGKRKTIHPKVPQQIPYAIEIYREIEKLLGSPLLHLNNIYQVYGSVTEKIDWTAKSVKADFAKYILTNPQVLPNLKQELGACEITCSGWVDCELLIAGFARWLKQNDALIEEKFLYEDLRIANAVMEYHGMEFNNIIFCEGYHAIHNPFFGNENIIPCKGNVLTIEYDGCTTDHIIKKSGIYIVPKGDNIFKAGSTYQWNNSNKEPDEAGKKLLENRLNEMLENKFTAIDHKAGIRPTTQNREVIARQHPRHAGMFMLNGLGARGVLQGPWWARQLMELYLG